MIKKKTDSTSHWRESSQKQNTEKEREKKKTNQFLGFPSLINQSKNKQFQSQFQTKIGDDFDDAHQEITKSAIFL